EAGRALAAANLDHLLAAAADSPGRNDQAVFDYCYFHVVPAPVSIYRGIAKLPAAHSLVWQNGTITVAPNWMPDFQRKVTNLPTGSREARLRELLGAAVTRSLAGAEQPAAFLSGGLDSSTVAGMLSERRPAARAYCIGFEAEGYDEVPFARITAEHFGISLREYYLTPDDIVATLPELARSAQEPFGNSSILPAYYCAMVARREGVDRMLAGDGGDELFAGNERYIKQKVFSHYARLPGAIRSSLIEPLARRVPKGIALTRKFASYVAQASTPLPDRLQSYNFLHRFEPAQMFQQAFLDGIDLDQPLQLLREVYHRPEQGTELDRMLYHDWQVTLADNDLRKVSHACHMADMPVSYPMLDSELADFAAGIPDHVLLLDGNLRGFYKQALKGWLPDATVQKTKHGFGLPFGIWMRDHKPLQDLVYEGIAQLGKRDIFRPDFLSRSVALHREGHASYYGELLWVLTCLEFWLEARQGRPTETLSPAA
ncbi:MAG: asparagine synthetase B family protein, partial [Parahaliea sp.]